MQESKGCAHLVQENVEQHSLAQQEDLLNLHCGQGYVHEVMKICCRTEVLRINKTSNNTVSIFLGRLITNVSHSHHLTCVK